jgi:flagellar hook-associated protein 3 FlgL
MRVASSMFPDTLANQLGLLEAKQLQLQTQAATGQRVQNPEDDPAAVRQVLDMQAENRTLAQYQSNISKLQSQASASYDSISALQKISSRIGEIATLADGTKSQQDLNAYATEVGQLIQRAVEITNSKFNGGYLFGGTLSDQPPFVVATNSDGHVTGVTYQGNTSVSASEIATGATVSSQTLGANTTGSGPTGLITDSRTGADFFNHMIALQNNLLAGNTTDIANTLSAQLTKDDDNFTNQIATNAALQARLDAETSIASNRAAALTKQISGAADADLSQTLVQLSEMQTAYQAALQSGAKVLSMSLLDYLK